VKQISVLPTQSASRRPWDCGFVDGKVDSYI
jgi:hypothetical protein